MAERARASIETTAMHDARGGDLWLTASFGVAEWTDREDDDALVTRADVVLYRAKSGGRNRIVVASAGAKGDEDPAVTG